MAKTRKSYTKIKNFTEKDQVRVKYSYIGKDKKLMLSVYIGEDVYNELTNGQTFKRLKVEYIPNDMVIITPTNNEKEGIVHRYNGKGLFKTTCVRLSLSSYKKLKIRKKDFNNRVVSYLFASRSDGKCLNVDLIGNKRKSKFIHDNAIREIINFDNIVPQDYVSNSKIKPLEISALTEDKDDTHMFVSHHFLNDVRSTIENRLLNMEERCEKRILEFEDYFIKKLDRLDDKIMNNFKICKLEEDVEFLRNAVEINVSATQPKELDIDSFKKLIDKENNELSIKINKLEKQIVDTKQNDISTSLREINYYKGSGLIPPLPTSKSNSENTLDIDTLKQLFDNITAGMNFRLSKIEQAIGELDIKNRDIKSKLTVILSLLSDKKSHEHKSLFEKIFGKD